jgi:hypothetical protein
MPGSGLDRRAGYRLVWWVSWISAPNVWQLKVPLWMFAALLGAGAVGAWAGPYARYRRLRATRCPSCAYDRAGLAADVRCPECGTVPAPAAK